MLFGYPGDPCPKLTGREMTFSIIFALALTAGICLAVAIIGK